jgi:arylformamidase
MKIFDITRTIHPYMPIYPGNPKVEFEVYKGETSTHTRVSLGTHTGTHVDAPKHVFENGKSVDALNLEDCYGECRVIDVSTLSGESITRKSIASYKVEPGERILFKTRNSLRPFDTFYEDFVYLDGDMSEWLAHMPIRLVGVDYLSVKKKGGIDNRPHTAFLEKNIPIFEGLDLSRVDEGVYTFVGLPMKYEGLDGSPVRAMLIANNERECEK